MTRGRLAKQLNINPETIRYYETIELISPNIDKNTGYRIYDETAISKLELIISFKNLGFSLKEIKIFFELVSKSTKDPGELKIFINNKLNDIDNTIASLKSVRESLISFRDKKDKVTCTKFSKFIDRY